MFTIGLLAPAENEQTPRYVAGVLKYVAEHPDLALADFSHPGENPDLSKPPPWIGKASGVVTVAPRLPGIVPWLRRGRVPVVNVGSDLTKDLICVHANLNSIAAMGVKHFLELGFRHFALVGYRHSDGAKLMVAAFTKELARHELPLRVCLTEQLFTGTYRDFQALDEVEPELPALLRAADKPLAVIAANDRVAAAVCRIVQALELTVPEDVAVLGVRDLQIARISSPPISSIRLDSERYCYEAARLLHRIFRGEKLPRRAVKLPVLQLVARESTIGKVRVQTTDVARALEYIQKHACEGIRNEDVANHVYMSLRTFEIQFAAATGHTVGEEIRTVRLQRAKHLLETTDLSISAVAKLVAMNDGTYLNHFFRRWTGTTPLAYRRQSREATANEKNR